MDDGSREAELERRVRELEAENLRLRRGHYPAPAASTVHVPEAMTELFAAAQATVSEFFQTFEAEPSKGTLTIAGERYVLVRAAGLSHGFLSGIRRAYADRGDAAALNVGKNLLFDMAHVVGQNDARNFAKKMGLTDPIAKLSAGPVHFAHAGWAFVNIRPESSPSPDDEFFLIYDHPYSFESDSWMREEGVTEFTVCVMNSGYSSGWCRESFGIDLTSVEISCKARGDPTCTFIMAPPHRIEEHLRRHLADASEELLEQAVVDVPSLFVRKRVEEQLREAFDKAEAASRIKSQFLANMSHEVRTPLNGVLGISRLLQGTELTAVQREYVDAILCSGSALLTILNDILEFSKLEAGKLETATAACDVRTIFTEVSKVMLGGAIEQGLDLKTSVSESVPSWVSTDSKRLRQVLLNLVGNAIKFTEEGHVALRASWVATDPARGVLRVEVCDTGIGVAPEDQARMFEEFAQADGSDSRCRGGTGLGLSICKQLVELLGGEIGLSSATGEGTTAWFTIPAEAPAAGPEPIRTPPQAPSRQFSGRVLVVEDNRINQLVAHKLLEWFGCSVTSVGDGQEAVSELESNLYDLVLMDCQMPRLDGYEATGRIRLAQGGGERTPIVAMTASIGEGDRQRCLDAGMDDFLAKPVHVDMLERVLERWLG